MVELMLTFLVHNKDLTHFIRIDTMRAHMYAGTTIRVNVIHCLNTAVHLIYLYVLSRLMLESSLLSIPEPILCGDQMVYKP